MSTINEIRNSYQSDVASKAAADAAALGAMAGSAEKAGAAMDVLDSSVKRAGPSADAYARRLDDVTKSGAALSRQQAILADVQAKMNAALEAGEINADVAARAIQKQTDIVVAAQRRHDDFTDALTRTNSAAKEGSGLFDNLGKAFGVSRYEAQYAADNVHQLADQLLSGGSAAKAFAMQMPQITMLLGGTGNVVRTLGGFLAGPGGLAAAAVAAGAGLAGMAYYAEQQEAQLAKLSTQLRATRTDAASMAAEATAAAKALAVTSGWNKADAQTATQSIASQPYFSGSQIDLENLSQLAKDVASRLGTDLAGGLSEVDRALTDPAAELQALAQRHLPGVDAALAQAAQRMDAAGDHAGAVALAIKALGDNAAGASTKELPEFEQALNRLKAAADPLTTALGKMSTTIGTEVLDAVTKVLNAAQGKSDGPVAADHLPTLAQFSMLASRGISDPFNPAGGSVGWPSSWEPNTPLPSTGLRLVTNKTTGAMGMGQVMPSTAAALALQGIDVRTTDGNILGSASTLGSFLSQRGSYDGALAGYGGFVTKDPSSYIHSVMSQANLSSLPSALAQSVMQAAGRYTPAGYDQSQFANVLAGIFHTESGVQQFKGAGYVDNARAASDAAKTYNAAHPGTEMTRDDLQAQIDGLQKQAVALDHNSLSYRNLTENIDKLKVEQANAITPQQQITRGLNDQLQALAAQPGYWRSMAEVQAQFSQAARGTAIDQDALTQAMRARQVALAQSYYDATAAQQRQAQAQQAIAGVSEQSAAAISHVTNMQQAQIEADGHFAAGTPAYNEAVAKRVKALDDIADAQRRAATMQQNAQASDNLQYIQDETATLGMNADARTVLLAKMQAEIEMHRRYGDVLPQEAQRYIDLTAQVSAASVAYQHQQQVLSDLSSALDGAFETLGDSITQAFVQGSGSAVNFKNILAGLETQLASAALKFAVLNPLSNSLFGTSKTTLSDLSSLLGGSGSTVAPSGSIASGSFGYGGLAAYGATGNAGSASQPSIFGQLGSLPGAFGAGGTVNGLGSVGSWLNTKPGWLGGNTSYAGAIGAAGYGVNGILDFAKGGTGNTIAGIGSTAAAAMAFIPGLQAFAPIAAIGGSLLGSLFGGHPKNPYTIDNVQVSGGQLALGQTWNQAQNDTITAQLRTDIAGINSTLSALGVTFASDGQIGSVRNDPNNKNSALQSTTLQQELAGVGLTSKQASLNTILATGLPSSYDSVSSFQTTIASMKSMADTVDALGVSVTNFDKDTQKLSIGSFTGNTTYSENAATAIGHATFGKQFTSTDLASTVQAAVTFADTTYPGLVNATIGVTQTYADQIKAMQTTYQGAITQAQAYGLSIDALSAKQQSLTADMWRQAQYGLDTANDNMQVRYLTATGQTRTAELLQHDVQADADYKQLDAQYQAIYGSAWQSAATYERDRTQLIQTESAERLAIEQKYQDAATAAAQQSASQQAQILATAQGNAGSLLDGITSYTKSLLTDDSSPFTAAQKYQAANHNWLVDLAKAQGGDVSAMGSLTGDASAFLTQSRTYNGSSAQATADYQAVLDGLKSVAMLGAGSLTQAFMTANTQDQTQTLVEKLDELKGVLMDTQQITMQASRRAAMG